MHSKRCSICEGTGQAIGVQCVVLGHFADGCRVLRISAPGDVCLYCQGKGTLPDTPASLD